MALPKDTSRCKCLDMEDIEINVEYAITINPSDKFQCFDYMKRMDCFKKLFNEKIRPLVSFGDMCTQLYLEISKMGRLHYHGTIEFQNEEDIGEFFLNKIHLLIDRTSFEIDTISDPEIWYDYCTKQKDKQSKINLFTDGSDAVLKNKLKTKQLKTIKQLFKKRKPSSSTISSSEINTYESSSDSE